MASNPVIKGIELGDMDNMYTMYTSPKKPDPPEGFIDNTVYRYRLKPDGTKEFIGTMPPFPEGWNDSMKLKEKRLKGVEKMVRPKREAPPAEELRLLWEKHEGKINPIAKELRTSWAQARQWLIEAGIINSSAKLIGMGQTSEPKPAEAANQEPERESQEPAQTSLDPPEDEVKEEGFGPEDDEPIPYQVAEDATLDEMKVIWIENVLTHCTQAKTQLQYIQAIMDLRV